MAKLSILMLTYNHEKYIKEAIDSILMQKVNFDYEIIIGEDCSTDNTREIIKEYKDKYPDKFKLILNDKNIGPSLNCINISKNCRGQYIAFLEGDDFWTDQNKLQRSVDFLDNNPDYIATAHDVNIIDENYNIVSDTPFGSYKGDLKTPLDQFKYNNIPTLSLVFRNVWGENYSLVREKLLKNVKIVGDFPFKLLLLTHGSIKYFKEKMGTYRWIRNSGASFSTKNEKNPNLGRIDMVNSLINLSDMDMDTNYKKLFNRELIKTECSIIAYDIKKSKRLELKDFMKNYISNNSIKDNMEIIVRLIWNFIKF